MKVKKVNAFTDSIYGGNPAGVVTSSSRLTDEQMKQVTKKLAVSETAFVFPSRKAEFKLRFFSPELEVDLCGHATIATFFTLAEEDIISPRKEKISITQETKAGVLPVNIYFKDRICEKVMMTQGRLVSKDIKLKVEKIAKALNIKNNEIDTFLPQKMVSTGLFTLPVCVKSFDILQAMKPNFDYIKTICMEKRFGSFHVFTFETIEKTSAYHARNFAPYYGINEDPVTGTANGAVTAFLVKNGIIRQEQLVCEQGDIIGRPGRVQVEIKDDVVMVGGKAKLVEEKEIEV